MGAGQGGARAFAVLSRELARAGRGGGLFAAGRAAPFCGSGGAALSAGAGAGPWASASWARGLAVPDETQPPANPWPRTWPSPSTDVLF